MKFDQNGGFSPDPSLALRAAPSTRYIRIMSGPIRIPDGFVEELKARIRPSDVIGRKVKLKKQGKEWVG
ncbi:MAG: hypothetical protein AAGA89_15785, partial [Pseudomonadota bacterium]